MAGWGAVSARQHRPRRPPPAGRPARALLLAALSLAAAGASAHEFWMLPGSFGLRPGQATTLSLAVGQDFRGDAVAFAPSFVLALRHIRRDAVEELRGRTLPGAVAATIGVRPVRPGTHLFMLDTDTSRIELPADRFEAYLRQEGLEAVLQARTAAGLREAPGRERFRRNVKTLVQVGPASDDTYARSTGQVLEILPTVDPFRLVAPATISFRVLFAGQPLPGALVKLWHGHGPEALATQGRTDAAGNVSLGVRAPGVWMASVVQMVAAPPGSDFDWDSYWGNLTFAVAAAPAQDEAGSGAERR